MSLPPGELLLDFGLSFAFRSGVILSLAICILLFSSSEIWSIENMTSRSFSLDCSERTVFERYFNSTSLMWAYVVLVYISKESDFLPSHWTDSYLSKLAIFYFKASIPSTSFNPGLRWWISNEFEILSNASTIDFDNEFSLGSG